MKVLFVSSVDIHINMCYKPYIKYFKDLGYSIDVVTGEDTLIDYSNKIKIPIKRQPLRISNVVAIFKLRKLLKKENYDLIITSTPMGSVVARFAKRNLNTKLVYIVHGFHFYKGNSKISNFIYYNIEKYLMKYVDTLITINKEDYYVAKNFKTNTKYIKGIGYDLTKLDSSLNKIEKEKFRKKLGIRSNDYVITYVAEISKRKRQTYLVKTLSKMDLTDILVLLVGSGKTKRIEKLIKKYKLENNIKLLGFRSDISEILDITDLYVSVSDQEGLPLNVMEAMHKLKPIIVTDCRGNGDLIKNNYNGIVVPINNKDELIKKINYLKENYEYALKLGKKNKNIINEYSIDNVMKEYIKIFSISQK